jgi:hypothetical protein
VPILTEKYLPAVLSLKPQVLQNAFLHLVALLPLGFLFFLEREDLFNGGLVE